MEPDNAGASKVTPLDAERARLRAAGYTDAEISQILIARASAPQQATGGAGQAAPPGVFSGMLGNVGAAMSYGRSFLPTLRGDLVKTFDRALSPIQRIEAALFLAFKVAVIAVIAYAVNQEWQQHIVAATEKANADALRAQIEADALAHRPCLVQGADGCQKFGLNAAEAEAAAKTGSFPAGILGDGAPRQDSAPTTDQTMSEADQKEIARIKKKLGLK